MYGSASYWRSTDDVDIEFKIIKNKSLKLEVIKININIHIIGFIYNDLETPFLKNVISYS